MVTTSDTPVTIRAYAANGTTLLCEYPDFVSLSVLDAINDVGSFQWTWNLNSGGSGLLISDTALQIAVMLDARNGSGYQEVWRGIYEQDTYDPTNFNQAQVTAQGRSMVSLLSYALVYPQAGVGSTTTSWSFTGESPGGVMEILLTAAQARGWAPGISWSFTSGQDSSGNAWANAITNAYSAGTDLMSLLTSLAQGGLCDFNMTGSVLNMYNPNTTLGVDLSSTVFLRRGRDIVTAPQSRDRTQIGTAMLAIGDNGLNIEVNSTTYGALGRYEVTMQQSGVTDAATLTSYATLALSAIDDEQVSVVPVYAVNPGNGTPVPWVNYKPGNYISVDLNGTTIKYRANQLAIQCGPGGPTMVQPTLNDVFYSREILVQNTLSAISGGAVITGTASPGIPQPGPNSTVPGVPAFITADVYTAAYYSPATGTTLAQIELAWTTPTNTNGSTMIDGANYIVQYRLATTPLYPLAWSQLQGQPWSALQGNPWSNPLDTPQNQNWTTVQVGIDDNNLIVSGLICGETYDFQIACTDVSGNTGSFSAVSQFVTATDNVAPQAPDAPTVYASMVAVQVYSDLGSSSGGTFNLPQDLDHLEVHYSYDPAFVPIAGVGSATYLGKLIANAGMINAQIPAVGTFNVTSTSGIYIKLIAVDQSGNVSPPSPGSGVTAVLIDDSHISSLSVSKLIAGTITATIILGGTIETASSGARAGMDMTGLWCYNAAGTETFFANASTGAVTVQTSATGQRVIFDSLGIHAYNAENYLAFDLNTTTNVIILGAGTGGNEVTLDISGQYPTVYMYDVTGTKPVFFNAVEFGSQTGAGIGINTAQYSSTYDSSTVSQRLYMSGPGSGQFEVINSTQAIHGGAVGVYDTGSNIRVETNGTQDGGLAVLNRTSALYGLFPQAATHGGQLIFNYQSSSLDCTYELDGYHVNNGGVAPQTQEGQFGGQAGPFSSSVVAVNYSFGATMFSAATVLAQYTCTSTTSIPATVVSANSVTGFVFNLSAASPSSWGISWWGYRYR